MRFGEEIVIRKELTQEEDKTIQLFFDSLPFVIRGITADNFVGNLEKRVPLEISSLKRLEGPFVLQPLEGCKIKFYLDEYLTNSKDYEVPGLEIDAGIKDDPRPLIKIYKTLPIEAPIKNWNYTLNIYLISK